LSSAGRPSCVQQGLSPGFSRVSLLVQQGVYLGLAGCFSLVLQCVLSLLEQDVSLASCQAETGIYQRDRRCVFRTLSMGLQGVIRKKSRCLRVRVSFEK
jgi:hypothetical protein